MAWLGNTLILTIFLAGYAVVHSFLASLPVKQWARRTFGPGVDRWYRLVYNIIAVVTLLPILPILVWLPSQILYVVPAPWRWVMVGGQFVALIGLGISLGQTGLWHFLGLSQLLAEQPDESSKLSVHGVYSWVRHPLYFFSLLWLWLTPLMTTNLLIVYILFTLYFYIGSLYEEKRLLAKFGPIYAEYQRRVPRLIPYLGPQAIALNSEQSEI